MYKCIFLFIISVLNSEASERTGLLAVTHRRWFTQSYTTPQTQSSASTAYGLYTLDQQRNRFYIFTVCQTKLLEGNVFSRVCLSFCSRGSGGPHVTIIHDALDLTIQPLSLTSLYRDPPQSRELTVQGSFSKHGISLYRDPFSNMRPHCTGTPYSLPPASNI